MDPAADKQYPQRYPYAYPGGGGTARQGLQARLQHSLHALKRVWWIPVLACILALAVTAYRISLEPTTFESTARLYISGRLQLNEATSYLEEISQFFGTQRELLLSTTLAKRAADRVRVLHPRLVPCEVKLDVRQARASTVIEITASGLDGDYTAAYLAALIDEFFSYRKEVRAKTSDNTLTLLYQAVQEREVELSKAQLELRKFRETNDVVVWQEQGVQIGHRLNSLQTEISNLETQQRILRSILQQGGTNGAFTVGALSALEVADGRLSQDRGRRDLSRGDSPLQELGRLDEQVRLLTQQRAELAVYLQPRHPKMQSIAAAIERAGELRTQYLQEAREWSRSRIESMDVTLQALRQARAEAETEVRQASVRLAGYTHLSDNVERIKGLYTRLLDLLQSVDVNKTLDSELLSVMEPAGPAQPATREIPQRLVRSALVGLFLGLGVVWLIGRYDDRILSVDDIEDQIDEEVIGLVPLSLNERRQPHVALVHENDRRHSFAESFRNIRSSLLFVKDEDVAVRKTILVTSAVPGEGKSTIAANLAGVLSMSGSRVLLIDGDLRRGTLHEIVAMEREPGLSGYLTGRVAEAPIRPTDLPRLSLLATGQPVTNSGELFLGARFRELMARVRNEFDFVIIDSPPVFAADDATTLAPRLDATLFVARSGYTRGRMAYRALTLLRQRNSRILGVVLNMATRTSQSYYYGYRGYYHTPTGEPAAAPRPPRPPSVPRRPTPPDRVSETIED